MAGMPGMPPLRPSVGFCIQTQSSSSSSGRWFINMCKHKMCEMPVAYSGKPVSRDFILTHGIGNMRVPFDIGSYRKVKERAEGAKQTTYCIDAIFNPLIIQLFMEDEFCNKLEQFRPFVINLALKRIEESTGVRLAVDKVKLVKTVRYKDGEEGDNTTPREFADLPGNADCFDEEAPKAKVQPASQNSDAEPLIQDMTPGARKPAVKKGFLNNSKKSLYGEEGSGEGVVPENAGDPMGWMPKKLRNSCKIVDCNDPEYQKKEQQRKVAEERNDMQKDFSDTLAKDMEKWCKAAQPDKWEEDLPDRVEPVVARKYNNDYSRFDRIEEAEEPKNVEERDWYVDSSGQTRRRDGSAVESAQSQPEVPSADTKAGDSAMKKGFFGDAKKPLYPKGSEQKAPMSEEQMMKELMEETRRAEGGGAGERERQPQSEKPVQAKTPDFKVPDFELNQASESLQLSVSVPGLESMQDVQLDVTEKSASLGFPLKAGLKPLKVELPTSVVPTQVRAKFSKKTKQINVTMPLLAH